MRWPVAALALYGAAFAALVLRGRVTDWPTGVAFVYSTDEPLDDRLAQIFTPAYAVARPFGVTHVCQPLRSLR